MMMNTWKFIKQGHFLSKQKFLHPRALSKRIYGTVQTHGYRFKSWFLPLPNVLTFRNDNDCIRSEAWLSIRNKGSLLCVKLENVLTNYEGRYEDWPFDGNAGYEPVH